MKAKRIILSAVAVVVGDDFVSQGNSTILLVRVTEKEAKEKNAGNKQITD